jgi:hypothetical protein
MLKKVLMSVGMMAMVLVVTGCDAADIVAMSLQFAGSIVSLF